MLFILFFIRQHFKPPVTDQLQTAGLGTTAATTALVVDTNNRQLHIEEISLIKKLAKERAQASCNGNTDCEARTQVAWADLLERVAEGLVDDQANEKNLQYLGQVINSAAIQGSNGSWGDVEGYLTSWQEAYNILSAYNSQQITSMGNRSFLPALLKRILNRPVCARHFQAFYYSIK